MCPGGSYNEQPSDPNGSATVLPGNKPVIQSTVRGGLGPFRLLTLASENLEEYTNFSEFSRLQVLMCSDASRSTQMSGKSWMKDAYRPSFAGFVNVDFKDKKISLRSLVDNSVVESFGAGGKTCITSRVYPTSTSVRIQQWDREC
ncbi:UNVERIFIED_CONTAM: Beta-fructofuranosidase, insoluble isoenzyme 2 [Sesamum calycinum]|uniref:Beta-fructofuranosidase, insoluble isoenzyme 2 n=1 Tax=Sesamum calycinum TaxID=2727403 RepID=A0AAW2NT45_9LAMI